MSPFRRKDSPHWQVAPTVVLPGRGRVRLPARATRQTRKAHAVDIETTLRDLPRMGYADLLEWYIEDPDLTPDELHAAKLAGKLDELRGRRDDPPLAELVEIVRERTTSSSIDKGARDLLRLAPDRARFSFLLDRQAVRRMLEAREAEGVKRNTVRRSLYLAISEVLDLQLPRAERLDVLAALEYGPEDDERKIHVTRADLERLLDMIVEPQFLELVRCAVTTGIDLGPLLRIRPRHLSEDGKLQVFDSKTSHRQRTIWIPEVAQTAIRRTAMLNRAGPSDRVWTYTSNQVWRRWVAAADAAELTFEGYGRLRFKDLRAVFATAYLSAGGNIKNLMEIMGHSRLETTVRYVKRLPIEQSGEMADAATWLGVNRYLEATG